MNPRVNISRIATLNHSRFCIAGALTVLILSACASPGAETQVGPAVNATEPSTVQESRKLPVPLRGSNPNEHHAHRNVDPQATSTADLGGNPNEHLAHSNH